MNDFSDKEILKLAPTNAQDLTKWKKCIEKDRIILLEGVRDHLVMNVHGEETPYIILNALTYFFQNSSDHRKLELKDKLLKIKTEKGEKNTKLLDQLYQISG